MSPGRSTTDDRRRHRPGPARHRTRHPGRAGSPATPLFDLPRVEIGERYERLRIPGPGPRTELVCGAVSFTGLGVARLIRSLPPVLPAVRGEDAAWMRAAFEVIGAESRHPRPGSDVVTARLADILVVQVVRSWLESGLPTAAGWPACATPFSAGPLRRCTPSPAPPGRSRRWPARPGCPARHSPPVSATGSASRRWPT